MSKHFYDIIPESYQSNFSLNFLLIELKNKDSDNLDDKIIEESKIQNCIYQRNAVYDSYEFYKRISRYL